VIRKLQRELAENPGVSGNFIGQKGYWSKLNLQAGREKLLSYP